MQDWTADLKKPFSRQIEIQEKKRKIADIQYKCAQKEAKAWASMKKILEERVLHEFDIYLSDLRYQKNDLVSEKIELKVEMDEKLKKFKRMKWIAILYVRYKIGLMIAKVIGIFAMKTALIVGEIVLFAYITYRYSI